MSSINAKDIQESLQLYTREDPRATETEQVHYVINSHLEETKGSCTGLSVSNALTCAVIKRFLLNPENIVQKYTQVFKGVKNIEHYKDNQTIYRFLSTSKHIDVAYGFTSIHPSSCILDITLVPGVSAADISRFSDLAEDEVLVLGGGKFIRRDIPEDIYNNKKVISFIYVPSGTQNLQIKKILKQLDSYDEKKPYHQPFTAEENRQIAASASASMFDPESQLGPDIMDYSFRSRVKRGGKKSIKRSRKTGKKSKKSKKSRKKSIKKSIKKNIKKSRKRSIKKNKK